MSHHAGASSKRGHLFDWRKHRDLDTLAAQGGWRGRLFKWFSLSLGIARLVAFLFLSGLLLGVTIGWIERTDTTLRTHLIFVLIDLLQLVLLWFLLPRELRTPGRHAWLTRLFIVFDRFEAKLLSSRSQWSPHDLALLDRVLGGWRGALWSASLLALAACAAAAWPNTPGRFHTFTVHWFIATIVLSMILLTVVNTWFGYRKYRGRLGRWFLLCIGVLLLAELPELLEQYRAIRSGADMLERADRLITNGYIVVGCLLFLMVMGMIALLRNREHEAHLAKLVADAERERLAHQLTTSQLKLLQAQIEPHFLFNTLGAVQQLAEGKAPEAVALTSSLIRFLRGSMASLRAEITNLNEEKKLISAYLDIMKVRMGARLDYHIDFPESLGWQLIPPTMLITLVENAIKHGLEPKPSGGRIDISAQVEHGQLRLTVADTGRGFSDIGGTGVGLSNIRERLALTYGKRASLELEENEPEGFIAHIVITLPESPLPASSQVVGTES
ncbi:sensor histidine kinase [Chitinimonas lacunae]|uniref:Sensor histidine kinase n=1 Tax=Chitinimonas lacunae TaxID=1963018 RepID=A0ABV8MRL1_9NEIS